MDASGGAGLLDSGHAMLREMETLEHDHDRGRQQHRLRRRLRAVDGVRLPPRGRVGDVRPARDQPRHHPRLRRHAAAAAARGRGQGARDEPDRATRSSAEEAYRLGLAHAVVPDHELFDTALELGAQAGRPGADRDRADQDASRTRATSTRASRPRSRASRRRSAPRTRSEGISRVHPEAQGPLPGQVLRFTVPPLLVGRADAVPPGARRLMVVTRTSEGGWGSPGPRGWRR